MYKERRLMNNYYNIHINELIVLNKIYLNDVAKMLMLWCSIVKFLSINKYSCRGFKATFGKNTEIILLKYDE